MEIPRRRKKGEARDTARTQGGERHGECAAHAIAHHRRPPARALGDETQRAFEALHIGGEIEAAFVRVGRAPIHEIGPQPRCRHGTQQAFLLGEIEHLPAIDQRGHNQHGACFFLAGLAH